MRLYLALVLVMSFLLANCSPYAAEAISLKTRKIKGRPGIVTPTQVPVRCGDYVCESPEDATTCPRDCYANAYSAVLDNTAESFNCGDPWSSTATGLSVAMWVNPANLAVSDPLLVKTSAREFILTAGASDASKVRWSQGTNSANWCETAAGVLVNGTWTHVVATWDGTPATGLCKIYINGALNVATTNGTIQNSVADGTGNIQINVNSANGLFLGGSFDEVAVWRNRALTDAEAAGIYNSGTPVSLFPYDPNFWWRMGDDAGDEFDTSATELLVDQMGRQNCTPVATDAGDKQAVVPP